MSEWTSIPLEDLADDITVGFVGSMTQEYLESGVPFLRSKNVEPYRINLDDLCYISSEFHQKIKKSALSPGDIVIVRTGKPGAAAIIPESFPVANCSDLVIVRPSSKLDRHFLIYYLNSIAVRHINSRLVGAVQQHFNIGAARELKIYCPSLEEQQEIASVLACLDRKIENLRRQNDTLERIAQTLFKHWFVDFEFPNEDGKPYKSSGGAMVRSELDEIPADWRVGKLGDEFDISIGRTPPRQESEWFSIDSKDVKWVSIRDMGSCGTYILETSEYLTKEAVSKFRIPIIPENTVILSFKLTVGRVAITTGSMLSNEAIAHLKISSHSPTSEYIYLFLSQFNFNKLGSTSSIATAVNSNSIKGIEFLVPTKKVASDFSHIINPLFSKLRVNTQQIQTLTQTRDVLLPKLMSGKLRITE